MPYVAQESASLLLPPGMRLLHIGPPKTGTTALQLAAAKARSELYNNGVYYPGTGIHHRRPFMALMNRRDGEGESTPRGVPLDEAKQVPRETEWSSLVTDIDAESSRTSWIGHESIARASDAMANRIVEELGRGRVHVTITLRPLSAILPSRWIQNLKDGLASASEPFDHWLERIYLESDPPISKGMRRYLDQGALVERWTRAAGPENVTVIVVDSTRQNLLPDTFEHMLGLPAGTLTQQISGTSLTNRSMSLAEAEIFRQVNERAYDPEHSSWTLYRDVLMWGAMDHVVTYRMIDDGEPRVRLPDWAVSLAVRDAQEHARRIAESGARIVGDLSALYAQQPGPAMPSGSAGAQSYRSIAIEALTGAVLGAGRMETAMLAEVGDAERRRRKEMAKRKRAQEELAHLKRRSIHDQVKALPETGRARTAASSFTTHDLARALAIRVRHKLRTGKSRPRQ